MEKRIFASADAMIGRNESVCGQIGVMIATSSPGEITGPPAEMEYPVEPVVVLTIMPSHRTEPACIPLISMLISTIPENARLYKSVSFKQ